MVLCSYMQIVVCIIVCSELYAASCMQQVVCSKLCVQWVVGSSSWAGSRVGLQSNEP